MWQGGIAILKVMARRNRIIIGVELGELVVQELVVIAFRRAPRRRRAEARA